MSVGLQTSAPVVHWKFPDTAPAYLTGRRDDQPVGRDRGRRTDRAHACGRRCCSTSAGRAPSTSRRGRIACSTSTRHTPGRWELPGLGEVVAPAAVLIRPDGYVAWVGDATPQGLTDALTTRFGPPAKR